MVMNWTESADAKLFAGVMATSEGIKLDYTKLADWMGSDCTAKAIQHRISHIKKMTKDTDTSVARPPKTPKTNGKRKAAKDAEEGDGDGNESPTKAKKPRAAPKKMDVPKKDPEVADEDGGKDESEEEVKIEDAGLVGESA